MTKKELVRLIREVVKREVSTQVKALLVENKKVENEKISIKEVLDQTKPLEDYPTMKTFNSVDARAGFAAMQNGINQQSIGQQDLQGNQVDVKSLGGGLDKALTRDYSDLVKKMKR